MAGDIHACAFASSGIVKVIILTRLNVRDSTQAPRSVHLCLRFEHVDPGILLDIVNLVMLVCTCQYRCVSCMLRSLESSKFMIRDAASETPEARHRVFEIDIGGNWSCQVLLSF